jgi:hypothetical protein
MDRVAGPPESDQQRLARNLAELLQELRVGQAGVQILFGFLLSVSFTDRYAHSGTFLHVAHLITVLFSATATALLTAPAAWHRLLFRQGRRERIIDVASRMAVIGLACLAAAMVGTVLLLAEVAVGGWLAVVVTAVAAVLFGGLWFVLPLRESRRDDP